MNEEVISSNLNRTFANMVSETSNNHPIRTDNFDADFSKTSNIHIESPKSVLEKHCFAHSEAGLKLFQAETLPMISNEYHRTDTDDTSESSFEKSSCNESKDDLLLPRDLRVKCLQNYDDLVNTCENLGLIFVDCSDMGKLYEVDLILDDKLEEGEKYYLVKWRNYDLNTSTWEPEYHLVGCQDLLSYHEYVKSSTNHLRKDMMHRFIREAITRKPYDVLVLCKLCSLIYDSTESFFMKLTLTELKLKVREMLYMPFSKFFKFKGKLLSLMKFAEARKPVLINLKEWEIEINSFNPTPYIEVENNVDLEKAPTDFTFIHDYISEDIHLVAEPVAFCSCDNCYENRRSCCPHDSDGPFPYNKFRRLQLLPGYPVYECNKKCKCGEDCVNRVVQHGQKVKVAIFRTANGCGWGLKTLETIQKDQFVLEYLGEILTSDAAEVRGKMYDYVGRSYLFDLDYGEENCQYTVDARHVGNASHFINHSCNPNLHVFAVWINHQDPLLPRLAFFAKRKICRGEELTFDYKMVKNSEKFGSQATESPEKRMECKCNSRNCRKYLF